MLRQCLTLPPRVNNLGDTVLWGNWNDAGSKLRSCLGHFLSRWNWPLRNQVHYLDLTSTSLQLTKLTTSIYTKKKHKEAEFNGFGGEGLSFPYLTGHWHFSHFTERTIWTISRSSDPLSLKPISTQKTTLIAPGIAGDLGFSPDHCLSGRFAGYRHFPSS